MIKVQLIVVQGKPEGKTIPLTVPVFQIGRDPTCHLRPSSDQVSRKHAEIAITADSVILKDLGSRNGTILNGRTLSAPVKLKSGDLVKIGHLTFAVSIQGAPVTAAPSPARPGAPAPGSLDEVPQEQVESWLIADHERPIPDRPSGVYDGDTITINAFRDAQAGSRPPSSREMPTQPAEAVAAPPSREMPTQPAEAVAPTPVPTPPAATAPAPAPAKPPAAKPQPVTSGTPSYLEGIEFEVLPEGEGDGEAARMTGGDAEAGEEPDVVESDAAQELIDESNPFFAGQMKSAASAPAAEDSKAAYKDSSDAAKDILNRMLERRRSR